MDKKGYYYLKLKENFFDTDEIKILESAENGYLYSNILLKLYLKALKNEGRLVFNEYIPYNLKMLSTITGHNIDVVEKAINIFKEMHLIDVLDNGTIYMLDMQKMIGSISSVGVRKQEYRERIKEEKENVTKLGQCPDILSISNSSNKEDIITDDKIEDWFNKVYSIYPRKVSKVQGKITFEHKFRGLEFTEAQDIVKGIYEMLKMQIEVWQKEDRKIEFIPHFSTWINDNVEDSKFYRRRKK